MKTVEEWLDSAEIAELDLTEREETIARLAWKSAMVEWNNAELEKAKARLAQLESLSA